MKRGWHLIAGTRAWERCLRFVFRIPPRVGVRIRPRRSAENGCALSLTISSRRRQKAFAAMTPTFLHPRCVNCHDVVDTSTGDFHLGGVVDPTARETRTVHRKNPETGADEKITEQVPLCSQCHIDSRSLFFFKGKDSIRLCRQMKGTMDNADRFMGPHL